MNYRCVATSVAGFLQQLAVCYVGRGYFFYVQGTIPAHKDPAKTDQRIASRYGLAVSKWTRCRRRKQGEASLQYLRHGRFFVIVATHGEHPFFTSEGAVVRDIRRHPLHWMGYSIGCRPARGDGVYHPSIRIEPEKMRSLKAHFGRIAVHWSANEIEWAFRLLPYEPYAPVRDQMRVLLRFVNRRRKAAGLEPVPREALRLRRKPMSPFKSEKPKVHSEPEILMCSETGGTNDLTRGRTP